MISLATEISNPVTRVTPFSSGPWPIVIWRSMRSFVSVTRRHVMRVRIDIEPRESARSSGVRSFGFGLGNAELAQPPQHHGRKSPAAILCRRTETVEKRLVRLRLFVKHARIDRRCQQIVRRGDCVNVARKMEVELFHGNDLAVAAARRAAFDAEGGPLARLADASEDLLVEVRSDGLAQADGGRGLSLRRAESA